MKVTSYILYALWVVSAIILKILGLVSWWVATSWLWIPFSVILCVVVALNLIVFIGQRIQEREEKKIPDSCETCLFGQAAKYSPEDKCLGEITEGDHKYGTLCPAYKRNIERKTNFKPI